MCKAVKTPRELQKTIVEFSLVCPKGKLFLHYLVLSMSLGNTLERIAKKVHGQILTLAPRCETPNLAVNTSEIRMEIDM